MSIFDRLKKVPSSAPSETAAVQKQSFTFSALPESLEEMQALPEAAMEDPFQTAALTVCALCAYAADGTWIGVADDGKPYDILASQA